MTTEEWEKKISHRIKVAVVVCEKIEKSLSKHDVSAVAYAEGAFQKLVNKIAESSYDEFLSLPKKETEEKEKEE